MSMYFLMCNISSKFHSFLKNKVCNICFVWTLWQMNNEINIMILYFTRTIRQYFMFTSWLIRKMIRKSSDLTGQSMRKTSSHHVAYIVTCCFKQYYNKKMLNIINKDHISNYSYPHLIKGKRSINEKL